jgi:hypothetical protein
MLKILEKRRILIPSSQLVRVLAQARTTLSCSNCGERMFVKYESGLCPLCFNGQRALCSEHVPKGLALGLLDEHGLEEEAGQ